MNSKKFRMNYATQGKGEKMSLSNGYFLFLGLTGENANVASKDKMNWI